MLLLEGSASTRDYYFHVSSWSSGLPITGSIPRFRDFNAGYDETGYDDESFRSRSF